MRLLPNVYTVGSSKTKLPLPLRWAAIVWVLFTFIWLPFEDTTTTYLLILSAGWCTLLAIWTTTKTNPQSTPIILVLIGGIGGLLIFPASLVLTMFKAGLHDHGFLDFTTSQLTGIARSTPIWVIIGLLGSAAYHYRHLILPGNPE